MKLSFCEGPLQDDTGCWYCPAEPWEPDYNCDLCRELHNYAVDQEIDKREFEERRKIRWGDS